MIRRMLAAALAAAVATPALAQGLDSRHAPYPASAYSGWIGTGTVLRSDAVRAERAPADRYAGPHAGGPADALPRF